MPSSVSTSACWKSSKALFSCFLRCLDLLAQHDREVDHHRIHAQDEPARAASASTAARPLTPTSGSSRDQDLLTVGADEIVDRVQVGHEVRRHRAGAERFVFGHGNGLQAQQQSPADAEDDVLGDQRELARLPDAEQHRDWCAAAASPPDRSRYTAPGRASRPGTPRSSAPTSVPGLFSSTSSTSSGISNGIGTAAITPTSAISCATTSSRRCDSAMRTTLRQSYGEMRDCA